MRTPKKITQPTLTTLSLTLWLLLVLAFGVFWLVPPTTTSADHPPNDQAGGINLPPPASQQSTTDEGPWVPPGAGGRLRGIGVTPRAPTAPTNRPSATDEGPWVPGGQGHRLRGSGITPRAPAVPSEPEAPPLPTPREYRLIEGIAGLEAGQTIEPTVYFSTIYRWLIGLTALITIFTLVLAGAEYTTAGASETNKGKAKARINAVFYGLAIILSAHLVLNLINKELLKESPIYCY